METQIHNYHKISVGNTAFQKRISFMLKVVAILKLTCEVNAVETFNKRTQYPS